MCDDSQRTTNDVSRLLVAYMLLNAHVRVEKDKWMKVARARGICYRRSPWPLPAVFTTAGGLSAADCPAAAAAGWGS